MQSRKRHNIVRKNSLLVKVFNWNTIFTQTLHLGWLLRRASRDDQHGRPYVAADHLSDVSNGHPWGILGGRISTRDNSTQHDWFLADCFNSNPAAKAIHYHIKWILSSYWSTLLFFKEVELNNKTLFSRTLFFHWFVLSWLKLILPPPQFGSTPMFPIQWLD